MTNRYTLENKPNFYDGEIVEVDMSCFGIQIDEGSDILTGRVVGKSITGIVDQWLIEFAREFRLYPYKVVSVPHTFILQKINPINFNFETPKNNDLKLDMDKLEYK